MKNNTPDLEGTLREMNKSKFVLSEVTDLTTCTSDHSEYLKSIYASAINKFPKIVATIINSIITHQRVHFILTRDGLRSLLKKDLNHEIRPKFSNTEYRMLLLYLIRIGITYQTPSNKDAPAIFTIQESTMLEHLPKDIADHQYSEIKQFVSKMDQEGRCKTYAGSSEMQVGNMEEGGLSEEGEGHDLTPLQKETLELQKGIDITICQSILESKDNAFAHSCRNQIIEGRPLSPRAGLKNDVIES